MPWGARSLYSQNFRKVDFLGASGHALSTIVSLTDPTTQVTFKAKVMAYCNGNYNSLRISSVSAQKNGATSLSAGITFSLGGTTFGLGAHITYDTVFAELKNSRVTYTNDVANIVVEIYLTYSYTATETLLFGEVTASRGGGVMRLTCSAAKEKEETEEE